MNKKLTLFFALLTTFVLFLASCAELPFNIAICGNDRCELGEEDVCPSDCEEVSAEEEDSDSDEVADSVDICEGYDDTDDYDSDGTPDGCDDSDRDGLTDYEELNVYGTDPLDSDSDDDGLSDGDEVYTYGTDPNDADTDGDGYDDGTEVSAGSNPLSSSNIPSVSSVETCTDTDNGLNYTKSGSVSGGYWLSTNATYSDKSDTCTTGLLDEYYCSNSTHAFYTTVNCTSVVGGKYACSSGVCAVLDTDGDGVPDYDELYVYGTDPNKDDTDGDGYDDDDEIEAGTDPDDKSDHPTYSKQKDHDRDGLSDYDERYTYGTSPYDDDSDNDGYSDYDEVKAGTDPLDKKDYPTAEVCTHAWKCTNWDACESNGFQTRTCLYVGTCTTEGNQSDTRQRCTYVAEEVEVAEEKETVASCYDYIQNQGEKDVDCGGPCKACPEAPTKEVKYPLLYVLLGVLVLLLIIGIVVYYKWKDGTLQLWWEKMKERFQQKPRGGVGVAQQPQRQQPYYPYRKL